MIKEDMEFMGPVRMKDVKKHSRRLSILSVSWRIPGDHHFQRRR
ncbi:hypothetical protein [Waltera sp.]